MRYEFVKVKRDTNTVYNRSVPVWEIPVLEFIFEDGNVERTGEFEDAGREYPEPAKEMERLVLAYGRDPQSGVPYAHSVYGAAGQGIRALKRAIEEETQAAEEAEPAPRKISTRKSTELDSLLT